MNWYYVNKGQRVGPLKEKEMRGLVERNEVGRQTKIWRKGLADWLPAEEVAPDWFGAETNDTSAQLMMCSACGSMEPRQRMTEREGAYLCASCAEGQEGGSHRRRHHRRPARLDHVKNVSDLWTRLMEDHFRELLLLGVTLFCVIGIVLSWRGVVGFSFPLRIAASTCYLLVALACGAFESKYGKTVLLGLFCCWIGSLALGIVGTGPLIVGLSTYLAGHCAFLVAFWMRGVPNAWRQKGLRIFFALAAVLGGYAGFFCVQASYRPFVVVYAVISAATFVLALGARRAGRLGLLAFVGACTLFAADGAIMQVRFVKPGLFMPIVALLTYYAGLHMLAFSTAYEFESAAKQ